MLDSMQLFLNDNTPTYHLTPLVVMNILSHYQRRPHDVSQNIKNSYQGIKIQSCEFVLGLLFGTITDTDIHITDSFGIPVFKNESGSILFSNDTINDTIKYHMMSHPNDRLVGWYQTGLYIQNNQALFHKMITQSKNIKLNKRRRISYDKALMLLVDTKLIDDKLNILGYVDKIVADPIESKELKESSYHRFDQVNLIYSVSSEQIAMDMIINAPPESNELDAPSVLVDDLIDLKYNLEELLSKMKSVEDYVEKVLTNDVDGDDSIGWLIMECFNKIANFNNDKYEEQISTKLRCMLMLGYLGKLTCAQLKTGDNINSVLHQTIPKFDDQYVS